MRDDLRNVRGCWIHQEHPGEHPGDHRDQQEDVVLCPRQEHGDVALPQGWTLSSVFARVIDELLQDSKRQTQSKINQIAIDEPGNFFTIFLVLSFMTFLIIQAPEIAKNKIFGS